MPIEKYLQTLGIYDQGELTNRGSYVITIDNSNDYGKMFSKLEKADDLDILTDNQVITEQGSSLMYESITEPFLFNLIADFDGDIYQLVITELED